MHPDIDPEPLRNQAARLLALHHGGEPLLLANVWDVASARLIEAAGFAALATTSSGIANSLGYPDGEHIGRDDMLAVVARICARVAIPVTADMEAGYGDSPEAVAETARRTLAAGAVGLNLEDSDPGSDVALRPCEEAAARVAAARAAAAAAGVHLVINARTDVYLRGGSGEAALAEATRRARAYRQAGADCLFVPGVSEAALIQRLVQAVGGPLNILAGPKTPPLAQLKALGVARVSVGGGVARAALAAVRRAAVELRTAGTFTFTADAIPHAEMNALLSGSWSRG